MTRTKIVYIAVAALFMIVLIAGNSYAQNNKPDPQVVIVRDYIVLRAATMQVLDVTPASDGLYETTATSGSLALSFLCKSDSNETSLISFVNTATGEDFVTSASEFVKADRDLFAVQVLEWKVQDSNAVLTFKGPDNLKYTATIGLGSGTVSQVTMDNEKYDGNTLAAVKSDTYIYDESGKVTETHFENTVYGNNGKADKHTEAITIYNKNGTKNKVIKIVDMYGTNNKLVVYTFRSTEYNADGTIRQEKTIVDTYGENEKLLTSERSTRTNVYNSNKTLKYVWTQTNNDQYNPSGTQKQTEQWNYYFEGAKLMAQRQEVDTYHNGNGMYTGSTVDIATVTYHASGRVSERSFVSYTYDADQKLIAKTVESRQYNTLGKETGHTMETLSKDSGNTDTELLQRKALESTIIAYANNRLFTSEMADRPVSAELPLQKK